MMYSAFILGLAGSLHCFGMCGPLSLLVPADRSKRLQYLAGRLVYNSGRIFTYILMGLAIGLIGEQAGFAIPQKIVFITLGTILLIYLLLPSSIKTKLSILPAVSRFSGFLKRSISTLHKKNRLSSQFLFGLLNGLIPCGLVYGALSASFLTADAFDSMLYMGVFGLGTLPMMLSFGVLGSFISKMFSVKPKLIYSLSYLVLAIFMLYKGINTPLEHYANNHEITVCKGGR